MRKKEFVQKIAVAFTTLALVAVLFSSCHRSYGCPGKITDTQNNTEIEEIC
ncbi:MAG: hypothetical protein ACPGXL_00820 [Chitinophagales bacterium]